MDAFKSNPAKPILQVCPIRNGRADSILLYIMIHIRSTTHILR